MRPTSSDLYLEPVEIREACPVTDHANVDSLVHEIQTEAAYTDSESNLLGEMGTGIHDLSIIQDEAWCLEEHTFYNTAVAEQSPTAIASSVKPHANFEGTRSGLSPIQESDATNVNEDVPTFLGHTGNQRSWIDLDGLSMQPTAEQSLQHLETFASPVDVSMEAVDTFSEERAPFPEHAADDRLSCTYSNRTSGVFSSVTSTLTYTDRRISYRSSQPLTPTISEFEGFVTDPPSIVEDLEDDSYPYYERSGFSGYTLPEADHASALTLRHPPSSDSKQSGTEASSKDQHGSQGLVESWNDGNEGRKTALQELVDDLGYLRTMIA